MTVNQSIGCAFIALDCVLNNIKTSHLDIELLVQLIRKSYVVRDAI